MTTKKSRWLLWIGSVMFCLLLAACGSGSPSHTASAISDNTNTTNSGGSYKILLKVPVPQTFTDPFCARIRVTGPDFTEIIMDRHYDASATSVEGVVPNIPKGDNRTVELGLFTNDTCGDLSLADWYGKQTGVIIKASDATIVQISLQKFAQPPVGSIIVRGDKTLILRRLHGEVVQMDTNPIGAASCRIMENGVEIGIVNSGIAPSNLGVLNTLIEVNTATTQLELLCSHTLYTQAGQEFADLITIPADLLFGTFTATVEMDTANVAYLPVFNVIGNAVTPAAAESLQMALGLSANPLAQDGSVKFVDAVNFLALPTTQLGEGTTPDEKGNLPHLEALNFDAIQKLPVLSQDAALSKTQSALRMAGLSPEVAGGVMKAAVMTNNSMFDVFDVHGVAQLHKAIDTQVEYAFTLNGLPLIGPGAKVNLSFGMIIDDNNKFRESPTHVLYALRNVQQGEPMRLIPLSRGRDIAMKALIGSMSSTGIQGPVNMGQPQLVYFAPAMSFSDVTAIYPHYLFNGKMIIGNEEVLMRSVLVPAVNVAPSVSISNMNINSDGMINAGIIIVGGKGPYQFHWESSSTELDAGEASQGSDILYGFNPKEPNIGFETLTLHVTDANGITTQTSSTIPVSGPPANTLAKRLANPALVDFGAEWINTCGGLAQSGPDANGFVNKMQAAGFTKQFNWGEFAAWESDFKDNAFPGGNDWNWVDNTDMVFYSGHANGDGFVLCSSHTDTFLHYNDARWGNRDLEWLVIAACGPLENMSGGLAWWQRWGNSFDGLHLLMGYASTSFDTDQEGRLLAEYMLGKPFLWWTLPPIPVRAAWVNAAIDAQPASVTWAVMGVYGAGGVSNSNDYFWTKGWVGPDLRGGDIWGWWKISGSS